MVYEWDAEVLVLYLSPPCQKGLGGSSDYEWDANSKRIVFEWVANRKWVFKSVVEISNSLLFFR